MKRFSQARFKREIHQLIKQVKDTTSELQKYMDSSFEESPSGREDQWKCGMSFVQKLEDISITINRITQDALLGVRCVQHTLWFVQNLTRAGFSAMMLAHSMRNYYESKEELVEGTYSRRYEYKAMGDTIYEHVSLHNVLQQVEIALRMHGIDVNKTELIYS